MNQVTASDINVLSELINKLNTAAQLNTAESEPEPAEIEVVLKKGKRGRKPKYANPEERHQAAIIHQREYRRRKKQQFEDMKQHIAELIALLKRSNANK